MSHLMNLFILIGAMLIAVQLRLGLPYGSTLPAAYSAQSLPLYLLLAVCALGAQAITVPLKRRWAASMAKWQFYDLLLAITLMFFGTIVLFPELSLLQLFYAVIVAIAFGIMLILFPARVLRHRQRDVVQHLRILWDNRTLLAIWVRNNVRARYTQTALGILWIILLPLAQALTLAFVFGQFIRMDVGDVPYISFFLAALVPWSFFNQSIMNSTQSITSMMYLINQIYFPREILVLVKLGETLVDTAFMFAALLVIDLLVGVLPNGYYVYLPVLFAITICFTLGLTLFLSYLSVILRDIPQLLFVIMQLLFYLTPIVYPTTFVPPQYRFLFLINPLAPLVQGYRDIITYQQAPNWASLYYPFVASLVLLYLGYSFFKAYERRLADFV